MTAVLQKHLFFT